MPIPKKEQDALYAAGRLKDTAQSQMFQAVKEARESLVASVLAQMKDTAVLAAAAGVENMYPDWEERLEPFFETIVRIAIDDAYRLGLDLVKHPLY